MNKEKMILGKNCIYSTDCSKTGLNNNVIVCGGSGSGKTMSISEPRLLETTSSSLVLTVTKRRIVSLYRQLFEDRGYEILDLNFADPANGNCTYDPLAYVSSYSDITFLAKSIVNADSKNNQTNADPYWEHAAVSLLSAEIAYTMMTKKDATFADVLKLHETIRLEDRNEGLVRTNLDYKFGEIAKKDPNCFAVSCWKSFSGLAARTAACIFGTLNTAIDTIFTPELREMLVAEKSIDFERIGTERTILFVTTSAVNPSLNSFVNLFYGQMFKQLFEFAEERSNGALPIPVHVLCDDFATGSRIQNFPEYISIFREKGISVTLLLQSESQLEAMYGEHNATTIINNCDQYVFMGSMDLKTGRNISTRLNAPLDEVLYMPIGQEILFRRGQRPIVTERYDILNDARYQRIIRLRDIQLYRKKLMTGKKDIPMLHKLLDLYSIEHKSLCDEFATGTVSFAHQLIEYDIENLEEEMLFWFNIEERIMAARNQAERTA